MKSMLIKFTAVLLIALAGFNFVSSTGLVFAGISDESKTAVCEGVGLTSGGAGCDTADNSGAGITGTIKLAVNVLSLLVGIAAVIMIIIGGFKYITSQGESSNTASAKNTVLYAIIGLIIVALAQLIVRFTLDKVGKSSAGCPSGQTSQADGSCQ